MNLERLKSIVGCERDYSYHQNDLKKILLMKSYENT